MTHETRATLYALAGGAPAVVVALVLLWRSPMLPGTRTVLATLLPLAWIAGALALHERVVRPLQTLSNALSALREGDFTLRARGDDPASPYGLAVHELNALSERLQRQRLGAIEATALLREVMETIDVAVFAFDAEDRLTLLNRGAEALLDLPAERALGATAVTLGLAEALTGETPRMLELAFTGRAGRWELRRGGYRWEGRPHRLIVLADLSRSLREEERTAWQRLVRVLSHEINNSLAPIKSIAGSLRARLAPAGAEADAVEGLQVIESRAEALGRFIQGYARLARLPRPTREPLEVEDWVRRVAALETRLAVGVAGGPGLTILADPDQMDALLINLVRNAADAALETGGGVRVAWARHGREAVVRVEDDGPGITDTRNLFVPFFTTKPGGTGIGLTLCRQVAEAHGGQLTLENRGRSRGAVAEVRLPGPDGETRPDPPLPR